MLKQNEVLNGTYQIIQEIGSGGMGVIYLAYHLNLEKYVVIKKIKDNFVGQIKARAEVDIMKNLRHTYIPQIYDFIQIGSKIYTVMNYIEGADFSHYIKAGYSFTEEELVKWLSQSLEVLDYLHTQNPPIIHSDIKPANIMLDTNDNICIIDFNISFEQDENSHVLGATAAYAPIEQMTPVEVYIPGVGMRTRVLTDARTDIYSLGATFYHLATHIKPNIEINDQYPIINLDIPYSEAFTKIIWKAMQKKPEDRYQSAKEMLKDLRNIRKSSREYKLARVGIISGCCLLGLLIGCGGVAIFKEIKEKQQNKFEQLYNNTIKISADYEPEDALKGAMDLLNNDDYEIYFKDSPEKKGNLLYQIATSYYVQENYTEANRYFEEATQYIKNSSCYRDYAISLVKSGAVDQAESILTDNASMMNELDVVQVEAELALLQNKYEQAVEYLKYVLSQTASVELKTRTLILLCEAYRDHGDYFSMEQLLTENYFSEENSMLRNQLLAEAYIGLASTGNSEEKTQYYKKAEDCLEVLEQSGYMSLNDALNLVIVYENQGKYEVARQKLSDLISEYSEDYRLYMQMSFILYNIQAKKPQAERNFAEFESYYIKTINLYNSQNTDGVMEDKVLQLKQIYQDLKDNGYL